MARLQAYCGLDCSECEAYIATQKNDRAGLEKAAAKWTAEFGAKNLTADMCVCDGCAAGKRASTAHAATCDLRLCASSRKVETCAHCPDYACETLKGFFAFAPALKDKLEVIRRQLGE
ncbi:MAG TPA: DUF3795 domain-containing protein [Phycisphaerae bacterium]|nr:DUF3795 domain-containing protein [Phycisphaerae bacterium]HRR87354.1 DUF3795 domain-containing protein [Phycisphaerae bacterium]